MSTTAGANGLKRKRGDNGNVAEHVEPASKRRRIANGWVESRPSHVGSSSFLRNGHGHETGTPRDVIDFLGSGEQYVPIFDGITRSLHVADILRLKRVNHTLDAEMSTAMRTQWNLNRTLGNFVTKPTAFRSLVGQVSAVISGPFVLDFLDRSSSGHRLDIVVSKNEPRREEIRDYIIKGGYARIQEDLWGGRDVLEMYQRPGRPEIIIIIFPMDPPIRAILRGLYPHTALTSFITASKVYAPFARWTFKDDRSYRFGLNGRINSIAFQAGVEIISQTGRELWDVEEGPKGPSYYDPEDWADYVAWPTTRRSLSDSETWSMDLNMTNVASSQQADDVADSTSFVVCTADHERLEHGFYHVF